MIFGSELAVGLSPGLAADASDSGEWAVAGHLATAFEAVRQGKVTQGFSA